MFKIDVRKIEDHTFILNVKGEFTGVTSAEFQKTLAPIIQRHPSAVSINLSQVDTMDESGIVMLMNSLMGYSGRGTYFYVIGLPEKVRAYYQARAQNMGHPFSSATVH